MMNLQAPPKTKPLLLQLLSDLALQVTPEQFAKLAAVNRDLRFERTATGELIVNPPTGGGSGKRNAKIITQLGIWGEANDLDVIKAKTLNPLSPNARAAKNLEGYV